MPTKKQVTFANSHGKSLSEIKYINKEGKSAKLHPSTRKYVSVAIDKESLKLRKKEAEAVAEQRVMAIKKNMKHAQSIYKDLDKLMKSTKRNVQMSRRLTETKKTLDNTIEQLKIDLEDAERKLRSQKKIG